MKRILLVVVAALAATAFTTTAASAEGNESADAPSVFCLNDSTVMEGDDIGPLLNWLPETEPREIILDDSLAEVFRFFIQRDGGVVGKFRLFGEGNEPLTDFNYVSEGPCTAPTVSADRSFWLCYSNSQTDPAVYSRSSAINLYEAGYRVPFAIRDPLSRTNIGNGIYLMCNLPAGYTVQSGIAVSTGGGDLYANPASLVAYMLGEMPLDYTRLAVRS